MYVTIHAGLTDHLLHSLPYLSQFGHGLENGLTQEQHLSRLMELCRSTTTMLLETSSKVHAGASLSVVEDWHFPGKTLIVNTLAGNPGIKGMKYFLLALRKYAYQNGCSLYAIPSRVSQYEYRLKYYPAISSIKERGQRDGVYQ
ncbi:hypothetical protein [Rickettsiella endosymbiont of Dermanyssus gallinae]|uniref:hypothetical protein n=1 Tax=Rickettsiella endosymbiont of Dermanyssus gallinae TaxID=2856608 RepID=UPI001C52F493|nr:hypothetical protein [Rickettsiella endosymbiont of Dermanyssus gallinae]